MVEYAVAGADEHSVATTPSAHLAAVTDWDLEANVRCRPQEGTMASPLIDDEKSSLAFYEAGHAVVDYVVHQGHRWVHLSIHSLGAVVTEVGATSGA